jgi:hypothetical protein
MGNGQVARVRHRITYPHPNAIRSRPENHRRMGKIDITWKWGIYALVLAAVDSRCPRAIIQPNGPVFVECQHEQCGQQI